MPRKAKAVERRYGPEKKFFSTITIRVLEEDKAHWNEMADAAPERPSLSDFVRGMLNRAYADFKKGRK